MSLVPYRPFEGQNCSIARSLAIVGERWTLLVMRDVLNGHRRFRDLYPDTPDAEDLPACEVVGVLGAVTGVIGTLMAMEAIKLIVGLGEPLVDRLLLYDGRDARFSELRY